MTPGSDETDFETALAEAAESLRAADPGGAVPARPDDPDVFVRALADQAIRRDVARILSMLAEQYPSKLAAVAPALESHLGDDQAGRHLLRVLGYVSDVEPDAVLGMTGRLVDLLETADPETVRTATWVLSNLVAADEAALVAALPALRDLLSRDDEEVRRRAARALAAAPPDRLAGETDLLGQLLDLLDSPHLHRTAERTLVSVAPAYGEQLPEALVERIQMGSPAIREHAAATIERLAEAHPTLVDTRWPLLLEIVREDDDHQVRRSAAAALAAIAVAGTDGDLLDSLVALTEHEAVYARRYGCLALGDVALAGAPQAAISALAATRDDEAAIVAETAEQVLTAVALEHPEPLADVAPDLVQGGPDDS
jgi:hypothetical protein